MGQIEDLAERQKNNTEGLAALAKETKNKDLSLWSQLITVQASVLGISISLLGYQNIHPGFWLLGTWIIEIISICTGFLVIALDIKQTFRSGLEGHLLSMNLTDIQLREAEGEFQSNEQKKMGMFVAAFRSYRQWGSKIDNEFKAEAIKLAEKYKGELMSSKMFKETPSSFSSSWALKILPHLQLITNIFYISVALSFMTLLLSLLLKTPVPAHPIK